MLYQIEERESKLVVTKELGEKTASELGIREKAIESWIADHPRLLFPNEEILVIARSISGQNMADILALDSIGRLVLVEIKRDWSDRVAVAQLLEYAASFQGANYDRLNLEAKRYLKFQGEDLISAFRDFVDNEDFPTEELGIKQRVFIVAPDSDEGLKKIVVWLKNYGVPIEFIPFKLLADADRQVRFINIEGVESEAEFLPVGDAWAGHWIFNTNESYGRGAYERMFKQGVIAIYGYPNGPRNLMRGASKDQRVFAYVNGQGIRAMGTIVDANVQEGQGIFIDDKTGKQQPDEYHMKVRWDCLLPKEKAISNKQAASLGYALPFRIVFGRLLKGKLAKRLEAEVLSRK